MDHDAPWTLNGHSNAAFHEYGGWGVFLFFVISGFLVCGRFLKDESRYGQVRLGSFYIRRLCRIQPAAFAYLGVVALLVVLGISHERWSRLGTALIGVQNYLYTPSDETDPTGSWFLTGHFWSLAVEEQFYLVLSLILVSFRRFRGRMIAALIAGLLVFQRVAHHLNIGYVARHPRSTELLIQYLLISALMAVVVQRPDVERIVRRHLQPWKVFLATGVAKVIWFQLHPLQDSEKHTLYAWILFPGKLYFYAFNLWVLATAYHPRSWTTRLLEWRPLRFVGEISYGLYLWHVLFFAGRLPAVGLQVTWMAVLTERPWRYIATFAAAVLSTFTLERYFRRLGHQITRASTARQRESGMTVH